MTTTRRCVGVIVSCVATVGALLTAHTAVAAATIPTATITKIGPGELLYTVRDAQNASCRAVAIPRGVTVHRSSGPRVVGFRFDRGTGTARIRALAPNSYLAYVSCTKPAPLFAAVQFVDIGKVAPPGGRPPAQAVVAPLADAAIGYGYTGATEVRAWCVAEYHPIGRYSSSKNWGNTPVFASVLQSGWAISPALPAGHYLAFLVCGNPDILRIAASAIVWMAGASTLSSGVFGAGSQNWSHVDTHSELAQYR